MNIIINYSLAKQNQVGVVMVCVLASIVGLNLGWIKTKTINWYLLLIL